MNPTIYDVSRLSGVSTATVSRAFSNPEQVREITRHKVLEAAEVLHYYPNAIARAMLIDGGSAEAGEYAGSQTGRIPAADYLRRRNIRALNLLVSTHIHEDHVCGLLDAVSVAPPAEMWQALPENLWREMRHIDPAVAEDPSMVSSSNRHGELILERRGMICVQRNALSGKGVKLCDGPVKLKRGDLRRCLGKNPLHDGDARSSIWTSAITCTSSQASRPEACASRCTSTGDHTAYNARSSI